MDGSQDDRMTKRIAALFDIDGTLIITGGAGAAAWRLAFDELYGEGVEELLPRMLEERYLLGQGDPP
jgi:beta-phosphoglucomutase-like phosphatase (HAD superfamily)